jgi:hypothetical protein
MLVVLSQFTVVVPVHAANADPLASVAASAAASWCARNRGTRPALTALPPGFWATSSNLHYPKGAIENQTVNAVHR